MKRYKSKKIQEASVDFDKLYLTVSKMISHNDHGNAIEYVAKILHYKQIEEIMKHINAIHKMLRYIPHSLGQYRDTVFSDLLEAIGQEYGEDIKFQIYSAF